jgi:glycosyltransferase involved in cell wall biosynthesis
MKIFEIGTGYTSIPAKMGAATEIVVQELTTSMLNLGYDVTIIDIKDKNRIKSNLPIKEVYMPQYFSSTDTSLGIIHKLKRVLYSISLTFKLRQLIRKEGNKVILHFHNQYNLFFFLKMSPKSIRKRVIIGYTVHSYIWFGKWEKIKKIIKNKYFQEVYCCQHADKIFVLNNIISKMLVDHYMIDSHNIIKVINGVNTNIYNDKNINIEDINNIKNEYNLYNKKIVLQVGSICDRKNQIGTLKLLMPIMKKREDVFFIYAGGIIDPIYADKIQQLAEKENIKNRVIYIGETSPGYQLNLLYSLSNVTIMNSKSEAFALVIAESLSVGRPIFINDTIMQSLSFLGEKDGQGIIRITNNFEEDFNKLMTDEKYYIKMQELGRNFIVNEYSWNVAANQYIQALMK